MLITISKKIKKNKFNLLTHIFTFVKMSVVEFSKENTERRWYGMKRYVFDYRKLDGRIHEMCGSHKKFANLMGISATTISNKLTNKVYFTQEEIQRACEILCLKPNYVSEYFFTIRL